MIPPEDELDLPDEFLEFLAIFQEETLERLANVRKATEELACGQGEREDHLTRIEIELHLDGVDKYISWTGLRFDAERYPFLAAIQDLRAAHRQLRALLRSEKLRRVR